jgi:TetR/AcrR family transcriptional regulator, transcriptional repressor of aconitase
VRQVKNELRREETRRAILNAAAFCFAEKGFSETGVAEICEQAGVSKGAFYYHFAGKQAVFLELLESWLANLKIAMESAAGNAVNVPESLVRLSHLLQGVFEADNRMAGIFLELWTQASRDETVRRASIATYREYLQIFVKLIEHGVREGTLEPVDPLSAAQALLSLASGLFLQSLIEPRADWGKVAADSMQILLDGLKRR